MGRKNKLLKFSDILNFNNVVENYDFHQPKLTWGINKIVDLKGRWASDFFKNENGITLELACGRGEYCIALGTHNPHCNYLGVDIKGARIWKGAKSALDLNLNNVGFLRTRIEQIHLFFDTGEISEIWITFPDPFLLKERNRLTHQRFLELYALFLKPGGYLHLKTDDESLYEFTLESLNNWSKGKLEYNSNDIYNEIKLEENLSHHTYYEKKHLKAGKSIKYIRYQYQV